MSAEALFQHLAEVLYLAVFLVAMVQAVRQPGRVTVDTALLFGAPAILVLMAWARLLFDLTFPSFTAPLSSALLMALPYLLLRLLDDFATVPRPIMRFAEVGLALSVLVLFTLPQPFPTWLNLTLVLYFVAVEGYAGLAFIREARRTSGVTRRRMQAVAVGSLALGLLLVLAGVQIVAPDLPGWMMIILGRSASVVSGLGYFFGFAPPAALRRAWQAPELRAFVRRTASLPRQPDSKTVLREIERMTAATLGTHDAGILLWDETRQVLRQTREGRTFEIPPSAFLAGRSFSSQRPLFSANTGRDDPGNAAVYEASGVRSALFAPVTAGEKRLGVMYVYAAREPIFASDDLALLQLMADQTAVIIENRALLMQAAQVQAREEATRLKDDFLSAAAHDLKTPLTTLLSQAQLLERHAIRNPGSPPDLNGIRRIVRESRRLSDLVVELLDVARVEQGQLVGTRAPADLVALAEEARERHSTDLHPCIIDADGPLIAEVDAHRILQLLDNLLENAVKYSPRGGEVRMRVWSEGGEAHLMVTDHGIGIPADDLPQLFQRFQRGTNVDDRRFAGMGLGLYICHAIAAQHGGRIAASSKVGEGTAITVTFPVKAPVADTADKEGVA